MLMIGKRTSLSFIHLILQRDAKARQEKAAKKATQAAAGGGNPNK